MVYLITVVDKCDFSNVKSKAYIEGLIYAESWGRWQCDKFATRDRINGVDEYLINYEYNIEQIEKAATVR